MMYNCPRCNARIDKTSYYAFDKKQFKETLYKCGSKEITEMGQIKWLVHFTQSDECKKAVQNINEG